MKADILYVDDNPDDLLGRINSRAAQARFLTRDTLAEKDKSAAARANLWVLDFFQDEEERLAPTLEGVRSNGLSVYQQLKHIVGDARPATVLVSSDLEGALGAEIDIRRRHVIALRNGVEWVADKSAEGTTTEILTLADAVIGVRRHVAALTQASAAEWVDLFAKRVLKLPAKPQWRTAASRDVSQWRPPSGNGEDDEGLAREVVGWMTRQVLAYPSFLISQAHVAARLRVSLASLRLAISAQSDLSRALDRCAYNGVLGDFLGPRYWSAGIDALAWDVDHAGSDRRMLLDQLSSGVRLEHLDYHDVVVVSDASLVEIDELAPMRSCVRAADENFPPSAPPAWLRIADVVRDREATRRILYADLTLLADAHDSADRSR